MRPGHRYRTGFAPDLLIGQEACLTPVRYLDTERPIASERIPERERGGRFKGRLRFPLCIVDEIMAGLLAVRQSKSRNDRILSD